MTYTVSGYIKKVQVKKEFATHEEARAEAKALATSHKGCRFNVTDYEKDIVGLTDHHWQWDEYFKSAVEFCHDD